MSPNPMVSSRSVTAMNASACLWLRAGASGAVISIYGRLVSAVSLRSARDANVHVGRLKLHIQSYPQRQQHLLSPRSPDISQIDHFFPAKSCLEKIDHLSLRFGVVSRDEHVVDAGYDRRVSHDTGIYCV